MEGSPSIQVSLVEVRSSVNQNPNHIPVAVARGHVQRGQSEFSRLVELCSLFEQESDNLCVSLFPGPFEKIPIPGLVASLKE